MDCARTDVRAIDIKRSNNRILIRLFEFLASTLSIDLWKRDLLDNVRLFAIVSEFLLNSFERLSVFVLFRRTYVTLATVSAVLMKNQTAKALQISAIPMPALVFVDACFSVGIYRNSRKL